MHLDVIFLGHIEKIILKKKIKKLQSQKINSQEIKKKILKPFGIDLQVRMH